VTDECSDFMNLCLIKSFLLVVRLAYFHSCSCFPLQCTEFSPTLLTGFCHYMSSIVCTMLMNWIFVAVVLLHFSFSVFHVLYYY